MTTLSRTDIARRVPAHHAERAVDVMRVAESYAGLGENTPYPDGWALPITLTDAADALVRAGMLTSPTPLRYLMAATREVVL